MKISRSISYYPKYISIHGVSLDTIFGAVTNNPLLLLAKNFVTTCFRNRVGMPKFSSIRHFASFIFNKKNQGIEPSLVSFLVFKFLI